MSKETKGIQPPFFKVRNLKGGTCTTMGWCLPKNNVKQFRLGKPQVEYQSTWCVILEEFDQWPDTAEYRY